MGGLNLGSYHGPHTFSKVSLPVVMGRSDPGLIHSPHTFSKVSSPFIDGRILLQLRCFKVALKFYTTMWTMREIIATNYIERETCGILLAIRKNHVKYCVSVCLASFEQLSVHHRSTHGGAGIPNNLNMNYNPFNPLTCLTLGWNSCDIPSTLCKKRH